jgi:hypothetical protein
MVWAWKNYTVAGASGFTQTLSTTSTSSSGVQTDTAMGPVTGLVAYSTSHYGTNGANQVYLPATLAPGNYTISAALSSTGTNPNSYLTATLNVCQCSNGVIYVNALFTAVSGGGWSFNNQGGNLSTWCLGVPPNSTYQVNVTLLPLGLALWGVYSTP